MVGVASSEPVTGLPFTSGEQNTKISSFGMPLVYWVGCVYAALGEEICPKADTAANMKLIQAKNLIKRVLFSLSNLGWFLAIFVSNGLLCKSGQVNYACRG